MNARHNYDTPKQSLEDEWKFDGREKAMAKKAKLESENAAGPAREPQPGEEVVAHLAVQPTSQI